MHPETPPRGYGYDDRRLKNSPPRDHRNRHNPTIKFLVDRRPAARLQVKSAINSLIHGASRVPRKKSPQLTEGELRLMNVVWEKGSATVGEVAEALKQ